VDRSRVVTLSPELVALGRDAVDALTRQDRVATTAQLVRWGLKRGLVAQRVIQGRWQRMHQGVVLLHSGSPSWREQARSALLYAGPTAALSHSSAAYVHGIIKQPARLVEVSTPRAIRPTEGVVIHRRRVMPWAGGRLRSVTQDTSVVDLVERATGVDGVVAVVGAAMLRGMIPDRILLEASSRTRVRHRAMLHELLDPGSDLIESPLEHRYARDVERAHALPRGHTQVRQKVGDRWIRADRVYRGLGVRIELDGQFAHPLTSTDDDVWRDNAVMLAHTEVTLRYRWSHVTTSPCATAVQVASALRSRGWKGSARGCHPTCPAGHFA